MEEVNETHRAWGYGPDVETGAGNVSGGIKDLVVSEASRQSCATPFQPCDGWRWQWLILPVWLVILLGLAMAFSLHQASAANGVTGQSDWCTVSQSGVLFCDYSSYQTCMANGHGDACVPNPERRR